MPVVSPRMLSKRSLRFIRFPGILVRSPRTVQQIQPLFISKISSSAPITKSLSTPISPNSFPITAIRRPCCSVRMRFRSVVLLEPRNPVRTVTGTFCYAFIGSIRETLVVRTETVYESAWWRTKTGVRDGRVVRRLWGFFLDGLATQFDAG